MKKILACVIASFVFLSATFAAELPRWVNFANDYAGTLSEQTETYINEKGKAFKEQDGSEIVAVVIESLEGMPIEDYAFDLFKEWGIGDKKEDKGILILLSVADREIRIEVGDGLEGVLNDAKTGRLIDRYAIPHFAENDFDSGIKALYDGVVEVVIDPESVSSEEESEEDDPESIILSVIIVALFLFAFLKFGKRGGGNNDGGDSFGNGGHYGSAGGFGSFRGRSGGGSGGGFGGFGGGSSSGGGASRKF